MLHVTASNNRSAEAVLWRFGKFTARAGSCLAAGRRSTSLRRSRVTGTLKQQNRPSTELVCRASTYYLVDLPSALLSAEIPRRRDPMCIPGQTWRRFMVTRGRELLWLHPAWSCQGPVNLLITLTPATRVIQVTLETLERAFESPFLQPRMRSSTAIPPNILGQMLKCCNSNSRRPNEEDL